MIRGLFISYDGDAQIIGEITSYKPIIITMAQLLPQLENEERNSVFKDLPTEQLEELLKQRKAEEKK